MTDRQRVARARIGREQARSLDSRLRFAVNASALAAVLCLAIITGWLVHLPRLTRLVPGLPTMSFNAALAFLFLSAAIVTACLDRHDRRPASQVIRLLVALAIVPAAATAVQYLGGVDFGIDQALVRAFSQRPAHAFPGRMPLATSLLILVLALGFGLARFRPAAMRLARGCALLAVGVAYVESLALVSGETHEGESWSRFETLSLPTVMTVLLLSTALLRMIESPRDNVLSVAPTRNLGASIARNALPLCLLIPAATAWFNAVVLRATPLPPYATDALVFGLTGLLFAAVVSVAAARIGRVESALIAERDLLDERVQRRTADLRRAERAAQMSQRRLMAIIDSAKVGIITLDADHRVTIFNAAAEEMFGMPAERMLGSTIDRLVPESARPSHDVDIARFEASDVPSRLMGSVPSTRGVRADGAEFPLEATISRVVSDEQVYLTAVIRDMTTVLALEAEREARHVAEASSRAKSELLSQVSHELNTPLNAIVGFAQLLEADEHLGDRRRAQVRIIGEAGRTLARLVQDLIDFGSIEAGNFSFWRERVDLNDLVAHCVDLMSPQAGDIRIRLPSKAPVAAVAFADRRRVEQIVLNLLSNAIKYNRPDGRVATAVRPHGDGHWAIHVRDQGVGLSAEQVRRLFEPFNRLGRERGRIPGAGIGLALSQRLAHAMGGRIDVDSTPDEGSTFTLVLPSAEAGGDPSIGH